MINQKQEVLEAHHRNLTAEREEEEMVRRLRADIETRDARIAHLEARVRQVVTEGEEKLARSRYELHDGKVKTIELFLIDTSISSLPKSE